MFIPFNRPYLTMNEMDYMEDLLLSLDQGGHICGDGKYSKKVQDLFSSQFGVKKTLLTPSCTSALELATHLLNLCPGDEVIVPSFTFTSTVNPVLLAGATPVFADIERDTLNIDPEEIRKKITPNTRAIYPVHYGGVSCDMDEISDIAADFDLKIVEDAAQGVNATYKGRYLGTMGDFGCYSFHETKNFTCGEGGALLINSNDIAVIERAEIIREKGTNRAKFLQGVIDKYTWVDIGSSYLASDLLIAFLYAQLEQLEHIQGMRMHVWESYHRALKPLAEEGFITLPHIPRYARHNAHLFYVLVHDAKMRSSLMESLKEEGIQTAFHYIPLHSSPLGNKLGYGEGDLPVTEDISERLLRLPLYAGMSENELCFVISTFIRIIRSM